MLGRFTFAALLAGMLFLDSARAAAANYTVTDLGTLGGDYSGATALNERGDVVGVAETSDGDRRAFLWRDGVMSDLGTLGGANSHAAAINEAGRIAGWSETADGKIQACLFDSTANVDLAAGFLKGNSYAAGINDHGEIVGWIETEDSTDPSPRAFLLRPTVKDLSILWNGHGVRGRAHAINNDQRIAGWTSDAVWFWGPRDHATIWHGYSGAVQATQLGGFDSRGAAVNDAGGMVGSSGFLYLPRRAVFWYGGLMLNLGSLHQGASAATGINNKGQIVGHSETYRFGLITNRPEGISGLAGDSNEPATPPAAYEGYELTRHAFLWRNGVMVDLNDLIPPGSGWELTEAADINDAGRIVGTGRLNGRTRAFLLTPAPEQNQIPFIRILSPSDGGWVSGATITFHVETHDPDGRVAQVDFYARRVTKRDPLTGAFSNIFFQLSRTSARHPPGYLGTATQHPFTLQVPALEPGNYVILAKATDDRGLAARGAEVLLRVNAPPVLRLARGPFISTPSRPADNILSLRIHGNEEVVYDIETSTDLVHWTKTDLAPAVLSHPFPAKLLEFPEPTPDSRRFYRAVAR